MNPRFIYKRSASHRERGSALIYILIAVALLAALTVSLMEPSNQQAQSQGTANLVSGLDSQISFITSTIQECVLSHPDQDSDLTTTQQKNAPYPINPKDPYLTTNAAPDDDADEIRCPGNPGGTGPDRKKHARMFGGSSGKFLPPPPALMGNWKYYNGVDGVYILIASSKSDAAIQTAMARIDAMHSACEVEVFNRLSAGALSISSDTVAGDSGVKTCPSGNICLRYWLIRKSTAVPADATCN